MRYVIAGLLAASIALLAGCIPEKVQLAGSTRPETRTYDALVLDNVTKSVEFNCSFVKVGMQDYLRYGDYCEKPANLDYVSYAVAPDIQSSWDLYMYLVELYSAGEASPETVKALSGFAKGGEAGMKKGDFVIVGPETVAVSKGNTMLVSIGKNDLALRRTILPTLRIDAITPPEQNTGAVDDLRSYVVRYTIGNYHLKTNYDRDWKAAYLGLLPYNEVEEKVRYDGTRSQFTKYIDTIKDYNAKAPSKAVLFDDKLVQSIDYVYPQFDTEKLKLRRVTLENTTYDDVARLIGFVPVLPGEVGGTIAFIHEYLPSYELERIEIVRKLADGGEEFVRTFSRKEIDDVVNSADADAALTYSFDTKGAETSIRYVHKAVAPKAKDITEQEIESIGTGFIYSDLGNFINTDLRVKKAFAAESMPVGCVKLAAKELGMDEKAVAGLAEQFATAGASCEKNGILAAKRMLQAGAPFVK